MIHRLQKLVYPTGKYNKNYTKYIGWSFCSNILVSAESVLATHSMLHAIDTGSETMRTVNYIGKDIIGQIGGLVYMAKMGIKSDTEPRKFLQYSNATQQISYLAMCATPLFPSYFLPIAGCANVLSNIAFTGFGAINARCIRDLAIDDNIGEIYAKISVVNTFGSSIGLLLGLGITSYYPSHEMRLLFLPILATARIYTMNKAIYGLIQ